MTPEEEKLAASMARFYGRLSAKDREDGERVRKVVEARRQEKDVSYRRTVLGANRFGPRAEDPPVTPDDLSGITWRILKGFFLAQRPWLAGPEQDFPTRIVRVLNDELPAPIFVGTYQKPGSDGNGDPFPPVDDYATPYFHKSFLWFAQVSAGTITTTFSGPDITPNSVAFPADDPLDPLQQQPDGYYGIQYLGIRYPSDYPTMGTRKRPRRFDLCFKSFDLYPVSVN